MIGLSDGQLEIVMRTAEPLAEESCQEFLERVAAALAAVVNVRGQITDDDVSAAVQLALRGLINNSAVWKNRNPIFAPGQAIRRAVGCVDDVALVRGLLRETPEMGGTGFRDLITV